MPTSSGASSSEPTRSRTAQAGTTLRERHEVAPRPGRGQGRRVERVERPQRRAADALQPPGRHGVAGGRRPLARERHEHGRHPGVRDRALVAQRERRGEPRPLGRGALGADARPGLGRAARPRACAAGPASSGRRRRPSSPAAGGRSVRPPRSPSAMTAPTGPSSRRRRSRRARGAAAAAADRGERHRAAQPPAAQRAGELEQRRRSPRARRARRARPRRGGRARRAAARAGRPAARAPWSACARRRSCRPARARC